MRSHIISIDDARTSNGGIIVPHEDVLFLYTWAALVEAVHRDGTAIVTLRFPTAIISVAHPDEASALHSIRQVAELGRISPPMPDRAVQHLLRDRLGR